MTNKLISICFKKWFPLLLSMKAGSRLLASAMRPIIWPSIASRDFPAISKSYIYISQMGIWRLKQIPIGA